MSDQYVEGRNSMLAVVSAAGDIVALVPGAGAKPTLHGFHVPAQVEGSSTTAIGIGIVPLPGQSLHLVQFPDSFFECQLAHDKHEWLQRHQVVCEADGTASLRTRTPGIETKS